MSESRDPIHKQHLEWLLAMPTFKDAMYHAAMLDYHNNKLYWIIKVRRAYLNDYWPDKKAMP